MKRYYFDLRDIDGLVMDDEGIEFRDQDAVLREATQTLADAARDTLIRPIKTTEAAIEVRDEQGPVMRLRFAIDIEIVKKH